MLSESATGGWARLRRNIKNSREGGIGMKYNIKKLEKELTAKVDTASQKEIEKINRYINLLKIFYELDDSIEKDGSMVITENGSQRFLKPNPAIAEKTKINTQLLAIERSFIFIDDNDRPDDGSDLV